VQVTQRQVSFVAHTTKQFGMIVTGFLMVILIDKQSLTWHSYLSFVGIVLVVRATACVGIDFCIGQMFDSTLETSEVLAEVSTNGLITMTFALKTKNDDATALIACYIFVNYLVVLPLSSYLLKSKVIEPKNEYSQESENVAASHSNNFVF
jgi:hypothetical protein